MMNYEILNIKDLPQEEFNRAFEAMSQKRKEKCLRYKFEDDRRRTVFADKLLKDLLCKVYNAHREDIALINLPSGKPVAYINGKEIFVSISHSGSFVACAVSDTPVGIDLEAKRDIKRSFIKRALSKDEICFTEGSGNTEETLRDTELKRFLKLWTAKEAYVKLTGEGLSGLSSADALSLIKGEGEEGLTLVPLHSDEYVCTVIVKE